MNAREPQVRTENLIESSIADTFPQFIRTRNALGSRSMFEFKAFRLSYGYNPRIWIDVVLSHHPQHQVIALSNYIPRQMDDMLARKKEATSVIRV